MKKLVYLLVIFLVIVFKIPFGYAKAAETLNLSQKNMYETANSLCFTEDTLYILGNRGIYAYKGNELTTCVDLSETYKYRYNPMRPEDEEQAAAWDKVISHLFTDGTRLYGLHPYTGKVFEITDGQAKEFAQLPQEILYVSDEDFYREIKCVAYANGKLVLLLGTDSYAEYDKTELIFADLKNQDYTASKIENVKNIASGEDGKLLVYVDDKQSAAIWRYDMGGDILEREVVQFEEGVSLSGLQCFERNAVYLDGSRVRMTDEKGGIAVKAYMPVQYASLNAPTACSKNGVYVYAYSNYVFLRDISDEGEADQKVLTIMGNIDSQTVIDFSIQNPDVAVVTRNVADDSVLLATAVSKDSDIDLFVLSAPGSYYSMVKNGYLAPIGSNTLIQEALKLYPALQDVVFSDELLYGYPLYIRPLCWTVNETKWNEFGLGEYPVTYNGLLELIDLWIRDYAADNPDYTVSELHQAGLSAFVLSIIEEYICEYDGSEEQFTFDVPSFRETLQKVAEYDHLFDVENEQWGMAMISSSYLGFGYTYTDSDLNRMVPRPKLNADAQRAMYAETGIMSVSAASRQIDVAVRFMEFCTNHLAVQTKYEMIPALNDPVENPNYVTRVSEANAQMEELKMQYEKATTSEKREAISELIAGVKNLLDDLENNRWIISEESIAVYRSMGEQMKIPYESVFFNLEGGFDSLSEIVMRFTGDGLETAEIDTMIHELNRVTYMVNAEMQ